jgi:hypothetical protein
MSPNFALILCGGYVRLFAHMKVAIKLSSTSSDLTNVSGITKATFQVASGFVSRCLYESCELFDLYATSIAGNLR